MKVLKKRGWEGCQATCAGCKSVVLVEAGDICYASRERAFYANCGFCCQPLVWLDQMSLVPAEFLKEAFERVMREPFEKHFKVEVAMFGVAGGIPLRMVERRQR